MCVAFFVIAVVALLKYLLAADHLRRKDDIIDHYEVKQEDWRLEREHLTARTTELERETKKVHTGNVRHRRQSTTHAAPRSADPPAGNPLTLHRTPQTSDEAKIQRKVTVRKVLRLTSLKQSDPKLAVLRGVFNKWGRYLLIRCPSASKARFSKPKPIEYFSPSDYSPKQRPSTPTTHGKASQRQTPQYMGMASTRPNGAYAAPYQPLAGHVVHSNAGSPGDVYQAQPVPAPASPLGYHLTPQDVYAPSAGLAGSYPYPSAVRHVDRQ